jgi:hypothetical protein
LRLNWATHEAAKYAVENWHYSRRMPKSKLAKIGVWENGKYIGVIIFGVGATGALFQPYGLKNTQGCELVRIALTGHRSPVTRMVSISIKILKDEFPGLRLVVSFADPGEGHHGGVYQGGGWIYSGRTEDCKFPVIGGRVTHPRTLSLLVRSGKVRKRSLVPHVTKPGKHRYLFPLDDEMRRQIEPLRKPYPKRAVSIASDVPANHAGEGGVTPTTALHLNK